MQHALMLGNSDGIGLATSTRLLNAGWSIVGISRSESPTRNSQYHHFVADVGSSKFPNLLDELLSQYSFDLCIYFVGIGELLNLENMRDEARIIDVNLTGMVKNSVSSHSQNG